MHVNKTHLSLWEKLIPSREEFLNFPWDERLKTLVWLGHLAPSSHNTQPWKFSIAPDTHTLTIFLDRTCVLPESDVVGREAVISVGCAIENIYLAARAYGLAIELEPSYPDSTHVRPLKEKSAAGDNTVALMTMHFTESTPDQESTKFLPMILTRKVMRAEFDPTKLVDERVLEELRHAINDDLVEIHLITDTPHRLSVSEFQSQADTYVLNSPRFAHELGDWLLPNDTPSPVGMPGNTFGFDDAQALRIYRGLRGDAPLEAEDALRFSLGGKVGFEKSPVIAFLTITKDDISGWIAAGRAMERAFLILEREGISYAVHAAIIEVRLVNRIFSATLGTLKPLAAVFRMGYVKDESIKKERPHSPRQPMESILLTHQPE